MAIFLLGFRTSDSRIQTLYCKRKKQPFRIASLRCGRDSNSRPALCVFASSRCPNSTKKRCTLHLLLAVRTRLELATPCVTGMYSNQLNYRTILLRLTSFSKASAKVLLFFDMTKYFSKKMQKTAIFLLFCAFLLLKVGKKWIFFAYLRKK